MGFELATGFTDHLQIVTTSNYYIISNRHTSQITKAHAKPPARTSHFPVMDLNNGEFSASVLMLLLSSEYPATALLLHLTNTQTGGHLATTS
jgi:hypothetical protein